MHPPGLRSPPPRRGRARTGLALVAAVAVLALPGGPAGPAPATAQPAERAAVVRFPFPQDDGTLTPYTFDLGYPLVTLLYDTLLWRDTSGTPQPWLAESVEPSPDGRRLTVRLREGVRWHDGVPLTAADVAFTYRFVVGRPHSRFTPQVEPLEAVEAVDARTVVFALRRPAPGFLDQPLADIPILPAHLWQGLPRDRLAPEGLPVGSGPYRLTEHRPGERYRFEANADYFRGRPAVGALEVPVIAGGEETLRAFERRDVDAIAATLTADAADRVDELGTRLLRGPNYAGTVLLLNVRTPPFDRAEVRRAVSRALDLRRIADAVGDAVPARRGYLHPESPWAAPADVHVFDEQAARSELARSAPGPVQLLAPEDDPVKGRAAEQVRLALQRVGVTVEVRTVPRDELSTAVGERGDTPSFQAAIGTGPALASYDPDHLRRVFGSPARGSNPTGYASPAFDAIADRVATTADVAGRRAAVAEALRLLADDAPAVPLLFAAGTFAYHPGAYDGWVLVAGSGILDKRSFVEPAPATPSPAPSEPERTSSRTGPLGILALALVGAAGVVALVALLRRD